MPLQLPQDSGALRLLQRIRDEAHRFANTYHQLLMKKRIGESILDDCPGRESEPQKSPAAEIRFRAASAQSERRRNCVDRRDRPEVGGGSAPLSRAPLISELQSAIARNHDFLFLMSSLCPKSRNSAHPWIIFVLLASFASPSRNAQTRRPRPSATPFEETIKPTWETQKQARTYVLDIPAPRGQITDRNGAPLAQNKLSYNLAIDFPTPLDFSDAQALDFARESIRAAEKRSIVRSRFPMRRFSSITTTAVFSRSRSRRTCRNPSAPN